MKSTSSLSLASAVLLSLSQWVSCNSMVFPRNNILLFESISNRTKVPLGQLSDGLAGRELPGGLEERQSSQCVDPGYVPCSNVPDSCCPSGYACFPDGCCNQARGRLVPCPNGKYCYLASSEICCDGGTCPDADTCCDNECCRSIAYCGSDGYCSACPDATVTRTTTWTYTSTLRVSVTTTSVYEPTSGHGFKCAPLTVSNDDGATLQLNSLCSFSYIPPRTGAGAGSPAEPTSTGASSGDGDFGSGLVGTPAPLAARQDAAPGLLQARQASCTPMFTDTSYYTISRTRTSSTTVTRTVSSRASALAFTCPTMAVTNVAGYVLSLDKSCGIHVRTGTDAEPTATDAEATATVTRRPNAAGTNAAAQGWQVLLAGPLAAAALL